MTAFLTGTPAAVSAVVEICILSLAGYAVFRRWEYTFAESWAYALMATMMTLSFLFQAAFLCGLSHIFSIVEWGVIFGALVVLWRLRPTLAAGLGIASRFARRHPAVSMVLAGTLLYLALMAYCIPPGAHHWDLLSRGLLLFRGDSWASGAMAAATRCTPETRIPLNAVVLPHLFLRYQTDLGVGLFGLMAYLCIGFSTYALSRRYVWPPTAIAVTLIVMSMPRFVLLATTPGFEIVPAAAALFCMLAVYRTIESPNIKDLIFLTWGVLFSIQAFSVYLAIPLIMLLLFAILLFRRHGFHVWWITIKNHRRAVSFALLPALVFSQIGTMAWSALACRAWPGNPSSLSVVYNPDGIQGALANLSRYLLQSAHFTQPLEGLIRHATGFSILRSLERLHAVTLHSLFGNRGAMIPFKITWGADERTCWFGPLAFLLVLPAVLYAVRRAPRRLKAITVALSGYFFLIALVLAWQPENVRHFDFFFACGGFCTAFFLTPWRLSARGRRGLMIIAALLMVYATAFNHLKPLLGGDTLSSRSMQSTPQAGSGQEPSAWHRWLAGSIWFETDFGTDRTFSARVLFGDDRVVQMEQLVPAGASMWVVATDVAHAYPILLRRPSARWAAARRHNLGDIVNRLPEESPAFLMLVDSGMPALRGQSAGETLWRAKPEKGHFDGELVRIN